MGPSHLSEVHTPEVGPDNMPVSGLETDTSGLEQQNEGLTASGIERASRMSKGDGGAEPEEDPRIRPSSPIHASSAHYFSPINLGAGPARNMKLTDHSSCESLLGETSNEPLLQQSLPMETPRSPRLEEPYTPCLEETEDSNIWKQASKIRQRSPLLTETPQTAARNQNQERTAQPPSPGGLWEPRDIRTKGVLRALGDIQGVLNERPPTSS